MNNSLSHYFLLAFCFLFIGCNVSNKGKANLAFLIDTGEFTIAGQIIGEKLLDGDLNEKQKNDLLFQKDMMSRIEREYALTEADVLERLMPYFSDSTTIYMAKWEKEKSLEYRLINGQKRFFKNAVPNLFRLNEFAKNRKEEISEKTIDSLKSFCVSHTLQLISERTENGELVNPVECTMTYTISVKADAVPAGEIIRCWMPYPKESNARQTNVNLLSVFPEKCIVAPDSFAQRSIYCEQLAEAGLETKFSVKFRTKTYAQIYDPANMNCVVYDTASVLYQKNTSERPSQIIFSDRIKNLADEICGGEKNPVKQVSLLYDWINSNIPWASALEYSIVPNIPEYVLENWHGDCGMQTLLFLTMARYRGIPVKWQSGWMLHPGEVNLHDWCEVYYEGIGWVPLDQSFGLQESKNDKVRNFYKTSIDSYRLIVNEDFSQDLFPSKIWPRSEPVDFQRGELEWKGGNLYFGDWTYKMEVTYN
ncbi:transglutaminase-like domain-containing protein [Labilibaculum manganireducens]|uniref:transglutaminase-like domain-containing protein n=1 Tax=Labilibaculum manganireducens TaxID=1940525 RepID=UPI000C6E323E|nr:transglutaminase-like domain-containing protein [Labilibaculum manganireducens]